MIDFDACDECGPTVRAYVYVMMPSGRDLTYCAHHGKIHREAIISQGGLIEFDLSYAVEG